MAVRGGLGKGLDNLISGSSSVAAPKAKEKIAPHQKETNVF